MVTQPLPQAVCSSVDNAFHEEILLMPNPPLVQLETISSHSVACYLGEELNTYLATPFFQVAVESDRVFPEPAFLLKILHQHPYPSLDTLQISDCFPGNGLHFRKGYVYTYK